MEILTPEEMKHSCIPFLGLNYQDARKKAAIGDKASINKLTSAFKDNPFFSAYIEYICTVDVEALKKHLCFVMEGWYQAAIGPEVEKFQAILERDYQAKKDM